MCANSRVQEFKKNLILETAYNLFTAGSFEAVTVEDIARTAGFGKSTLYSFFESKEEILIDVIRMGLQKLSADTQAVYQSCQTTNDVINGVIDLRYAFFCEFGSLLVSFGHRRENGVLKDEWYEGIRQLKVDQNAFITQILEQAIKEGVIVAYEPGELTRILDSVIKGFCFSHIVINGKPPNDDQDLEMLKDVIFNGIMLKE